MSSPLLNDADKLLSVSETAELLGVNSNTLATWRSVRRYDLPYVRVGRLVKYRLADVRQWLDSRSTQQEVPR